MGLLGEIGSFIGLGGEQSTTVTPQLPPHLWQWMHPESPVDIPGRIYDVYTSDGRWDSGNYGYYPGALTPEMSPMERSGRQGLMNYFQGPAQSLYGDTAGAYRSLMGKPGFYTPNIAPGVQANLSRLAATGGTDVNAMQQLLSGKLSPYMNSVLRGGVADIGRAYQDLTSDIYDRTQKQLFASDDDVLLRGGFGGSARGTGQYQVGQEFAKAQSRADTALQENLTQFYGDVMNKQFSDARGAQLGALNTMLGTQIDAGRAAGDIGGRGYGLGLDRYRTDMDAMSRAMTMAPQLMGMGMLPYQTMMNLGGVDYARDQAAIDAERARHDWNTMQRPWVPIQNYANLMAPFITGQPMGQVSTTPMDPATQLVGLGLGGMGIYGLSGGFGGGGGGGVGQWV